MKVDDKLLKRSLNAAIDFSVIKKEGFKDKVRKFDETIDFIINLKDINLKDPKSRIDKELILPNDIIICLKKGAKYEDIANIKKFIKFHDGFMDFVRDARINQGGR